MRKTIALGVASAFFATATSAATLEINGTGEDGSGAWNADAEVQTGDVGGVNVQMTTTRLPWGATFVDDNSLYANTTFYGPLAMPAGTTGDYFTQQTSGNPTWSWTLTFLDEIVDPIIYIIDADNVGGTVTVQSGWDLLQGTDDFSIDGDVFTITSGAPATRGMDFALLYEGTFVAGTSFVFDWDYSQANSPFFDGMGLGIATVDDTVTPPPIPIPASGMLLLGGVGLLGLRRKIWS